MTHAELIRKAVTWLRQSGHTVILTEFVCARGYEIPDVIGWKGNGWSALVEVKASRSDFKRDADKLARRHEDYAIGQKRYYLAPLGMIAKEEVPDGWGLLGCAGANKAVQLVKPSPAVARRAAVAQNELPFLVSALTRAALRGFDFNEAYHKAEALAAENRRTAQLSLEIPLAPQERGDYGT